MFGAVAPGIADILPICGTLHGSPVVLRRVYSNSTGWPKVCCQSEESLCLHNEKGATPYSERTLGKNQKTAVVDREFQATALQMRTSGNPLIALGT